MGCCSSSQLNKSYYEKKASDKAVDNDVSPGSSKKPKRSRFRRRSSTSSGIYSRYSTPTWSSTSCCNTPTPKSPTCNTTNSSIIKHEQREPLRKPNLSHGYHSEQMTSSDTSSTGNLCYTRDTSSNYLRLTPMTNSVFEMELYMISKTRNLMSNTSTPLLRHRNVTYVMDEKQAALAPATERYNRWERELQKNTTTMLNNVSCIPEALSGQFCPEYFPAYTECHPSKRYKIDLNSSTTTHSSLSSSPMEVKAICHVPSTDL